MKNVVKATVVYMTTLLCFAFTAQAQENPWDKKLPFESGTINYLVAGVETGTQTLYIRDYGTTTARYHNGKSTMMGVSVETKSIEFTEPDWIYNYDLVEKTGTKSPNPVKYMIEEFNALSKADKKKAMDNAKALAAGFQGMTVEPDATKMLGFSCDRISGMGTTILMIHDSNVVLNSQVDTMGMKMTTTATEIKTDSVPDKYFTHPDNIEAVLDQQASQMVRSMAQQQVQMLVEGQISMPSAGNTQQRMQHIPEEDMPDMGNAMKMMQEMMKNQQQ